jgi:hypothetical protein
MPHGKILPYHALKTLTQLHAELGGKIEGNRHQGDKLRAQMVQVEAVMKMLDPEFNARAISAKRRNVGNPWFKRGTLFRSAVDVLRRAGTPMTSRQIADALLAGKTPEPTRKQVADVQAAVLAALRKRNGGSVVGEGVPVRWQLIVSA